MDPLINRENTCCFTGHRPSKLPWLDDEMDIRCKTLRSKIFDVAEALYSSGIRRYICGMAMGCDMMFAQEVIRLRKFADGVSIEAAIPCQTQASRWPDENRALYEELLAACDLRTLVSREYSSYCMQKRNKYMVDNSSVLLAVYDGTPGGTKSTIDYAAKKGLEIIRIAP